MTPDPKIVADFFTYSPMDIAAMEERAAVELYKAKRTRFKYARELKLALRDRPAVERKPVRPVQQPPIEPWAARAGVFVGIILAPVGLAIFLGLIWIIQQAFK